MTLRVEKAYEKYAWVFLVAAALFPMVSVFGLIFATNSYFNSYFGSEVLGPAATDLIRGLSSLWLGMTLFGLAIILKPYRAGMRWAWYVLWYYPAIFLLHALLLFQNPYNSIDVTFNILDGLIPIPGLVLPYRKFFPKKP